jgi:lysophospholipase L1-like esterase
VASPTRRGARGYCLRAVAALALGVMAAGTPHGAFALSYVALGDSIAAGAGDNGPGGYVGRYRDAATTDLGVAITLQNLAVGGSTSGDLLAALTTDGGVQAAVAGADLVSFDIGGNDLLVALFGFKGGTCGGSDGQDCLRAALQSFHGNWLAILAELRSLNSGAMMRTMTYYNPLIVDLDPGDGTAAVMKPYIGALNATIRTTTPGFGIRVADVLVAFNGRSGSEDPIPKDYVDPDHIHPSPLGHAVISDTLRNLGYSPVAGTLIRIPSSLALKDDHIAHRKMTFTSMTRKGQGPANRIVPPPAGSPQDPTTAGATLELYNATGQTTDDATVPLDASGWTAVGPNGFKFTGTGAVRRVLLYPDKIKIKAADLGYSLDEPAQGAVAVRLRLASGGWCATDPARLSGTPPSSAKNDLPGKFVGQKNAPPPASCP